MSRTPITVCMATFNGAKYLTEQMDSIFEQLNDNDECIVVDDGSTDETVELLKTQYGKRIKLFINQKNLGVNQSFAKAIGYASNPYVFMADQDDVWSTGRVEVMLSAFESSNALIVAGNSDYIDGSGSSIEFFYPPLKSVESRRPISNTINIFLGRASYFGCAMAFKKSIIPAILPFPGYIESHDLWICKAGILLNRICHIEDVVLKRRIHGKNASVLKRPILAQLRSRAIFVRSYMEMIFRLRSNQIERNIL